MQHVAASMGPVLAVDMQTWSQAFRARSRELEAGSRESGHSAAEELAVGDEARWKGGILNCFALHASCAAMDVPDL